MPGSTAGAGRKTLIAAVGNLSLPVAAIATAPLLARGLGVGDRGELAGSTAPFLLAVAALTFGIPEALVHFRAKAAALDAQLLRISSIWLMAFGVAGGVLVGCISVPLMPSASAQVASVAALVFLPLALLVAGLRGIAMGSHQWSRVAWERIITATSRVAGIAALFITDRLTVVSAALVVALSMVIAVVPYISLFGPSGSTEKCRNSSDSRSLLSYGFRFWAGSVAGTLLSRLDQLLMVPLTSSAELGLYAVAVSLAEVSLVINLALRDVVFAIESHEPDVQRVARLSRISTLLTLTMCGAIGGVSAGAIPVLFGDDFRGAYTPLLILLLGVVIGNPGSICGAGLSGWGRPGLRSASIAIAATINTAAVFVLVPSYGASGAALATLVGNGVAGGLNIFFCCRYFGSRPADFLGLRTADVRGIGRAAAGVVRSRVHRAL